MGATSLPRQWKDVVVNTLFNHEPSKRHLLNPVAEILAFGEGDKSYNLCQKSWNICIISAVHLVVSPLPLKTMLLYTVLKGTERVAMLA